MSNFLLYPHAELVPIERYDWNPFGHGIERELASRWLAKFGGFDYGAMTVWLMRGFGLPNMRAYDVHKHSFIWGLETSEGYLISVEPGLVRITSEEYAAAGEERTDDLRSRRDLQNYMAAHNVLSVEPLHKDVAPITDEMINGWLEQFARPIYVRDVGGTVIGPIYDVAWAEDVGPGDESVLSGGNELADNPIPSTGV
jgi:hypothetical protein